MEDNGRVYGNGHVPARRQRLRRTVVLPPGVFFMPTDEELLGVYLRNRAAGRVTQSPLQNIPTREIYVPGADPWVVRRESAFPYCRNGEVYCFTRRGRGGDVDGGGAAPIRAAGSGRWVARGDEVVITAERTGEALGYKLVLDFVPDGGAAPAVAVNGHSVDVEERSNWIMHEYRLGGRNVTPSRSGADELLLCKIFQRREEDEEEEEEEEEEYDDDDDDDEFGDEEAPESSVESSIITFSD